MKILKKRAPKVGGAKAPRFSPGEPVFIMGTITKRCIVGKVVTVLTTTGSYPLEYSYIVEFFKHIDDDSWELREVEFAESMLLPMDEASKLLYARDL